MAKKRTVVYNPVMRTTPRRDHGHDLHRSDLISDRLYLRLFYTSFTMLYPAIWRIPSICSSYWRFYQNDTEGASITLTGEDGPYVFPLHANTAYFIPAGVRFDTRCDVPQVGHLYAHFDVTGLPGMLLRELFDRPVALPAVPDLAQRIATVQDILRSESGAMGENDLTLHCRVKAILYDGMALALEALPAADRERRFARAVALEPVLPALERIDQRLADHLSNADLAAECCWSEDYFIRRFKECVGEPPAAYVQARRVETAANRLLFSADSIEKIAQECGFGNRFYFSRVFARHTGLAPAAYRKTIRV